MNEKIELDSEKSSNEESDKLTYVLHNKKKRTNYYYY